MKGRYIYNTTNIISKTLLCSLLYVGIALGMSACSSGDDDGTDPEIPVVTEETAYLSFNIGVDDHTISTRGSLNGTPSENKVNSVRIVLYDGDDPNTSVVADVFDYDIKTKTGTSGIYWDGNGLAPSSTNQEEDRFTTKAMEVAKRDYMALAIVNPEQWFKNITVKGQPLSKVLEARKFENTGNTASGNDLGGLSAAGNFLMTNVKGLVKIKSNTLGITVNHAHNTPVKIEVGRVVSKVSLDPHKNGISLRPGAEITPQLITWQLDVTNKWTFLYRNLPQHEIGNDTPREDWYAVDPNFTGTSGSSDLSGIFNYRSMAYTPADRNFNKFLTESTDEYCLENTMDVSEQRQNSVITRAVIACQYKPANIASKGESYYVYKGKVYSLDNMRAYFALLMEDFDNIDLDICLAMKEALVNDGYTFDGEPKKYNQPINGPLHYGNFQYYYNGYNYYAVKILHHGNADSSTPGYGHYGVLRNTHYKVAIKSIDGPGSPFIPSAGNTTRSGITDDNAMYDNISTHIIIE